MAVKGITQAERESFTVLLRDIREPIVKAWKSEFQDNIYKDKIKASCGDIFRNAPSADALVSPANSFGFMDGGIDLVYSRHFGWQMQERLQQHLQDYWDGELPVGSAVIIPAHNKDFKDVKQKENMNEGKPIKYLISAPTMRVPYDVSDTVNSYLAFRAILRAVMTHNHDHKDDQIKSFLCPGLGTAVGQMPFKRCARQMKSAYNAVVLGNEKNLVGPEDLWQVEEHHSHYLLHSDDI